MSPAALKLANALGIANEHPDFPVVDWQAAVAQFETRDSYWNWVVSEMRYQNHAWLEEIEAPSRQRMTKRY